MKKQIHETNVFLAALDETYQGLRGPERHEERHKALGTRH